MLKYWSHLRICNLRKHWDMIPLMCSLTFSSTFAVWYTAYCMLAKPDVSWTNGELPLQERIEVMKKQKFQIHVNQEHKPSEGLEKAKAEIGQI